MNARVGNVLAVVAGLGIGVSVMAFGTHFADTRNWTGLGIIGGCFLLLMIAGDLTGRPGSRLRGALGTLTAVTVILAAVGGLYWIIGRHWGDPATYAAGVAWWAALGAVLVAASRVRRRRHWNKYGYSPQDRVAQKRAEALWPRRGGAR